MNKRDETTTDNLFDLMAGMVQQVVTQYERDAQRRRDRRAKIHALHRRLNELDALFLAGHITAGECRHLRDRTNTKLALRKAGTS